MPFSRRLAAICEAEAGGGLLGSAGVERLIYRCVTGRLLRARRHRVS